MRRLRAASASFYCFTARFCPAHRPSPVLPAQQSRRAGRPRRSCGKQVLSCQSAARLEQERTGLNRREQIPASRAYTYSIHYTRRSRSAAPLAAHGGGGEAGARREGGKEPPASCSPRRPPRYVPRRSAGPSGGGRGREERRGGRKRSPNSGEGTEPPPRGRPALSPGLLGPAAPRPSPQAGCGRRDPRPRRGGQSAAGIALATGQQTAAGQSEAQGGVASAASCGARREAVIETRPRGRAAPGIARTWGARSELPGHRAIVRALLSARPQRRTDTVAGCGHPQGLRCGGIVCEETARGEPVAWNSDVQTQPSFEPRVR